MTNYDEKVWNLVGKVMGKSNRILLYGPPGTGKSTAGSKLNLRKGQKVFIITVTEEMSMAEIRGHYVPKGGEFVWQNGIAIEAWLTGGRLVINEIDHASDDVSTFLHAILDDPEIAGMTLPNGEFVSPAKGFQAIATMNGIPEDLEEAIDDRFPIKFGITFPNPEALKSLPEILRDTASKSVSHPERERRVSLRSWHEFTSLCKTLSEEDAAAAVFGERAAEILKSLEVCQKDGSEYHKTT